MTEFAYRVIDRAGHERRGRMAAANENEARSQLEGKKLYVVALSEATAGTSASLSPASRSLSFAPRLGLHALALFTRQFATLVQVSPIGEALTTIARQTEKPRARAVVENVQAGVMAGQRVSDAFAREGKSFNPLYRAVVAAGDASGTLAEALERLAILIERRAELRGKIVAALAYPAVLAVMAVFVVTSLMIFVVPRMVEQFENVGQQLPMLTRIVMALSGFLVHFGWMIAIALALCILLFWLMLARDGARLRLDGWLLRLPIAGKLIRDVHAAGFARNLATMVTARLPLVQALELARETMINRVIRDATSDVIAAVRAGGSLARAMQQSGHFPPLLVYLAASGESAGRLDLMLERAADYLERDIDSKTGTSLALLEPAVIVIMGILVALIILSVLLPILQLESLAAR